MRVALLTTFAASRKEPLALMLERVHQGFVDAGIADLFIRFNFADHVVGLTTPCVDRVLKRHPELERFVTEAAPQQGMQGARRLSNGPLSAGANEAVPYLTLHAIAERVPRSYPFQNVSFHFYSAEFGEPVPTATTSAGMMAGVLITDSWWVNGRNRSLSACRVAEVAAGEKKLPEPSATLARIFTACGKVRKTVQAPLPGVLGTAPVPAVRLSTGYAVPSADPEKAIAVKAISVKYRDSLADVVARANLPHDLPSTSEMLASPLGTTAGPKKPALERVFKPMGYRVQGGTGSGAGTFSLRRRTKANSTLELSLDCGTWSHMVLAIFKVYGLGWIATLTIPPTKKAVAGGQYRIGDAENWQKIVENFGAVVKELERTMVPEIEAVAGSSPEWYQPEK